MKATTSSFRDPSGYVAVDAGVIKRVIRQRGAADFHRLVSSGLYGELAQAGLIVNHYDEPRAAGWPADAAAVIRPRQLDFVSYPYEWSFHQLQDAALLTLELQERALRRGLSLKDASAYNIQFEGCRPIFIDTLSFEVDQGRPWIAYEQFCRHFLGPLLLMYYRGGDIGVMLRSALDGFALPWTSRMLPWRSYGRAGALIHIHMHARYQQAQSTPAQNESRNQSSAARLGLLHSLRSAVIGLRRPRYVSSPWLDYQASSSHYTSSARCSKTEMVRRLIGRLMPTIVYDVGANTGEFSRVATEAGARCVSLDSDAECVAAMYQQGKAQGSGWLLPLVMDMSNPSPKLGAGLEERMSLAERGDADLTLMLGLVHHLRISANIPLRTIGAFLSGFSRQLLIEYVPPEDVKAAGLLRGRTGFDDYSLEGMVTAFSDHFKLATYDRLESSGRVLLHFTRRAAKES
jgi:hypothetical protein